MLRTLRAHLTYANVMSTLAVFLLLAGGGGLARPQAEAQQRQDQEHQERGRHQREDRDRRRDGLKDRERRRDRPEDRQRRGGPGRSLSVASPALPHRDDLSAGCLHPNQRDQWYRLDQRPQRLLGSRGSAAQSGGAGDLG